MAYIGKEPVYGNLIKQTLTPNGSTTAFSLDYIVSSAASLLVSVGGVIQEPDSAYSVTGSGTTITFTEAPAADVSVFIVYLGRELLVPTVGNDTVTTAMLQANAVTTAKIAESAVTTARINDLAVTTGKIAAGAVTSAKLDTNINVSGTLGVGGASTFSGLTNFLSSSVEKANVIATSPTANISYALSDCGVFYHTANTGPANVTVNFTGLNALGVGNVASFVVLLTNNTNPKYIGTVQIDGSPANTSPNVIVWQNGRPTYGTANIDAYSFSVIKASASAYTVIAQQTNLQP